MTIGIPRALAYYRYGTLWENFFRELNIPYIVSEKTDRQIFASGLSNSVDENCLPAKIYMGHIASLLDKCDYILVPHLMQLGNRDEFCIRFWGLFDTVRATFPEARLLNYSLKSSHPLHELIGFVQMGRKLGKTAAASRRAYLKAAKIFQAEQNARLAKGRKILTASHLCQKPKILIAANSYISNDPFLGKTVADLIRNSGAIPLFCDFWESAVCREKSTEISDRLYWLANREILGAIQLARNLVDGVILVTAFPCGADCLANEIALRRVKDVPMIQILVDEQQGLAGLETRIESFMDMLHPRLRKAV